MLRWLFLLFSIVWSSLLSSILAGSVYDMTADKWEHYPGGLAVHKNNSLHLIIKDHLTNTRAIVMDGTDNCAGSMGYQAQYDYYPYSKILRKQESPRSRFQSTDHEMDLETGYNNRNARWYDDESFQFLQTDPVADVYPSLTPYNYVSRKPISFIDPTGMYETEADAEANRLSAMRLGYKVDDVYKSGKEYVFNISGFDIGDFATAKSRDFVEAAKDAFNQPVDPIRKALMSDQIWQLTYNRDFGRGYSASGALGEPPLNTFDIITLGQGGSAIFKSFKSASIFTAKVEGQGGLNLFKWGAEQTGKSTGWKAGDYMLHLPNKGTPALNWKANFGALRSEMNLDKPIFDSYRLTSGAIIPTNGFLNLERLALQNRGWIYNPTKGAWMPPIK